jgi:hypothetical protein
MKQFNSIDNDQIKHKTGENISTKRKEYRKVYNNTKKNLSEIINLLELQ